MDLGAVDADRRVALHPVLCGIDGGIDLLLFGPEGHVPRQVHFDFRALGDLRGIRADVAEVIDGRHHVCGAPGHAAGRRAERGRFGERPGEQRVAALVLGIGDDQELVQELVHLFAHVPHLCLVERAVGALDPELTYPLEDVHCAAEISLDAGQRAAHVLDVLAVLIQAGDL